jgi:oligogalacturonide lyase
MIGRKWPSEAREFRDEKTGRTIRQLTTSGNNVHLYFTENSFDAYRNEIIFRSDRASGEDKAPHERPLYNLFRMDLGTGEIVQLTDEAQSVGSVTRRPATMGWVLPQSAIIDATSPSVATKKWT